MMPFDAEQWYIEITDLFKNKLNDCIIALNNKKKENGSDFEIEPIIDFLVFDPVEIGDSQLFLTWDFLAQDPNDELTNAKSVKYTMQFLVNMVDYSTGQSELAVKHLLRYQRAMIDLVNANFDKYTGNGKMMIEGIPPVQYSLFDAENNEYFVRGAGVNVSFVVFYS